MKKVLKKRKGKIVSVYAWAVEYSLKKPKPAISKTEPKRPTK